MDTGLIRKMEKARTYASQPSRMQVESLTVRFDGKNSPHKVEFKDGSWHCDCEFFVGRNACSHTMALEMVLDKMVAAA